MFTVVEESAGVVSVGDEIDFFSVAGDGDELIIELGVFLRLSVHHGG